MELATRSLASGSALPNILRYKTVRGISTGADIKVQFSCMIAGEFVILASQDGLQQCIGRLMTNYKR